MLLLRAEALHLGNNRREDLWRRKMPVPPHGLHQALVAKFFPLRIQRFRNSIRIDGQNVSVIQTNLPDFALPVPEKPQHRAGGMQSLHFPIASQQQRRKMSAIDITHCLMRVIVFGKEKRGIRIVGSIGIKKAVDGLQQIVWLLVRQCQLSAQIGLKIGHKQSASNSLSGNVPSNKADLLPAKVEKIVIISADLARLNADAGIIEGRTDRLTLRKEA